MRKCVFGVALTGLLLLQRPKPSEWWLVTESGLGPVCLRFKCLLTLTAHQTLTFGSLGLFLALFFHFGTMGIYLFDKQVFVGWVPEIRLIRAWLVGLVFLVGPRCDLPCGPRRRSFSNTRMLKVEVSNQGRANAPVFPNLGKWKERK